jgi:hypothetical protein
MDYAFHFLTKIEDFTDEELDMDSNGNIIVEDGINLAQNAK